MVPAESPVNDHDPDTTPHNIQAEQALLGALLYDNEIFHHVSNFIDGKHFYNPVHRRIFETAARLIEAGRLADAIVLKDRFAQDKTLVDIGGEQYLAELLLHAPSGAGATEYARLIFDMAVRRELIRLGGNITKAASDIDNDNDALRQITDAEAQLYNLAEVGATQGGFETFNQAMIKSIEMVTAAYSRDGGLSGIATGLIDLDKKLGGFHRSDLIIIAGRPSMGKTALATNIAYHCARNFKARETETGISKAVNGARVGFFSLEMSSEQLATRIVAEQSGVPSHKLRRGEIDARDYELIRDIADEISHIPFHIDDTGNISIGQLAARARRLKRMAGLDMIVVDYLQLLTGGRSVKASDNRVHEISVITQGLKALAKELDIPVLALAQLSRQVEQRENKRPQLADLRESGSIEQDADVVMFVFREEYYKARNEPGAGTPEHENWQEDMDRLHGKAEVIVGKQRHGPIGTINLSFDANLTKFSNLVQDDRYDNVPR
ncbi:MAG: replicative DNA helicase [Hyphomonadaceae bacterium]|nr:replicative DNA helicase [Hyphomonadaceae bacterium]